MSRCRGETSSADLLAASASSSTSSQIYRRLLVPLRDDEALLPTLPLLLIVPTRALSCERLNQRGPNRGNGRLPRTKEAHKQKRRHFT